MNIKRYKVTLDIDSELTPEQFSKWVSNLFSPENPNFRESGIHTLTSLTTYKSKP